MGAQGAESEGPVDAKALVAFVEGDWALARGLVQSFADTTNDQLVVVAIAIASGDCLSLSEAARAIKGASAILFATATAVEAGRLEGAAGLGDVAEI
jgi:HPt (histidine-containing phosphotransfer) domain-containing protein